MTHERDVFINCPLDLQYRRLLYAHGGKPPVAIEHVRNWLSTTPAAEGLISSGSVLAKRYRTYQQQLRDWCQKLQLNPRQLTFRDQRALVVAWLDENPWSPATAAGTRPS